MKKTDAEYEALLSPEAYEVTRRRGTERPFTGEYWDCHDQGTYRCVCCAAELFRSNDKFDSSCGWPSFARPVSEGSVATEEDRSHGMVRIEVTCSACGAHLGHVFPDGPEERGGLRYCINSASLDLEREG